MKTPNTSHWDDVYRRRDSATVSWYRPHLETSILLLRRAGLNPETRVMDAGGGASTLVDDLIDEGVVNITVADLSADALGVARNRLGPQAKNVRWMVGDLLNMSFAPGSFDIWHDRAVLHFLTNDSDATRYAEQLARAVAVGGHAVIGGFAPDGPSQCSGLPVIRRSATDMTRLLGERFVLLEELPDVHVTPSGTEQHFLYTLLRRA